MIPSSTKHPSTEWAGLPIAIPSRPWTSTSSRRRSLFFAREVGISTNRQRKLPRSGSESPAMATVKTKVKTGPTQTSMQKTSARVFLYSLLLTLQYGVQPLISKRCIRREVIVTTSVLTCELAKVIFALIFMAKEGTLKKLSSQWTLVGSLTASGLPATIYALQNSLLQISYRNLDSLTFSMLNQTKIIFTALFTYIILRQRQSMQQIVAVFLLILAAVFLSIGEGSSKRSSSGDPDQILFYGIVPVLVASVLSGLASALCQWASQVKKHSSYLMTIEMSIVGSLCLLASISKSPDGEAIRQHGFFYGWTPLTLIPVIFNSLGGILVGLVTSHAGGVRKDVGATVFPITMSLEQRYSPYHNNDFQDNDDFHNETEGDNVCTEPFNNTRRGTRFNNDGDDGGAGPSNVPSFQHEDECEDNTPVNNRGNRPIPSMVRSRRRIDPLTSLAPTLPSNMVAPSFVSSCDSDDISVGKLFAEKNELILQLRKRIDNVHTCHNEVLVYGRHQVRSRVVGYIIAEKYIQDKRIYTPNDIRADMQQEYGVQLTYQQAYRAREVGLEIVRGNPAESYNLLPKYSHLLTTANEGTVTHLEQDGDGNFLYYFVALGSSIKGFMQYIRPVIAVDSTHLKGLYRGSMFVAACLDGNNQLYPFTHLVDHFRKTLQQLFYDRKIVAESMTTRLTTWVDEIVTERRTIAERMIVRPVSPHRFQVIGGGLKEGLVDLQKRTCSCRVFQLDQLVCAHAITACLTHRVDFINLCSDFYTTESLSMTYAQSVEPVGDVADWEVPDEIQEMQVYPPVEAPPPGRRKELRIPSADEDVDRRTIRCGRCHELGHNRKRCKNSIASTRS
ncbi:UDP-N-acetylglucosamine transporter ROCK1 [Citrus sinensis]|nr:UDP-N-acetylglucosamine transporter ROCK1 [Citrus sinensis]